MSAVLALDKHCLHKCHFYSEDIEHLYSLEIYDLFLFTSNIALIAVSDNCFAFSLRNC